MFEIKMTDAFQILSLQISSDFFPVSSKSSWTGLKGELQMGIAIYLNRAKFRSLYLLLIHRIGYLGMKWTFNPWECFNRLWTATWHKAPEGGWNWMVSEVRLELRCSIGNTIHRRGSSWDLFSGPRRQRKPHHWENRAGVCKVWICV